MCVRTIVDASAFRHLCATSPNSAGDQLRRWIGRGDGIVVFSGTEETYARELNNYGEARRQLLDYVDSGRAIDIGAKRIEAAQGQIPDRPIRRSNDVHILALALAGEATVLFSCDKRLRKDFANLSLLGRVGRQRRSCVPFLRDKKPEDTARARDWRTFLRNRTCPFTD